VTDRHKILCSVLAGTLAFSVFGVNARAQSAGAAPPPVASAPAAPSSGTTAVDSSAPPAAPASTASAPAPNVATTASSSPTPGASSVPAPAAPMVPGAAPAVGAPAVAAEPPKPRGKVGTVEDFMERDTTWDLNLEGGLGGAFTEAGTKLSGMFRARAGVMFVRAPHFFPVGASYQWSNRSYATIDIQAEYMHLSSGLWLQVGPLLDLEHPRPGFMVSGGISIIGVELQQRAFADLGVSTVVMGKIRAPLGFLFWAFRQQK
jgi:hypothetical protein